MENHDADNDVRTNDDLEESHQQEDFAALFASTDAKKDPRVARDAKIEGTIVQIGDEWIFVDIGGKSEGVVMREELVDKEGNLTVKVGDPLTAYVVNARAGEVTLSVKMTTAASEDAIRGAFGSGVPVEGLVTEERKGGYGVTVFGKTAFCPYSQIDLQSGGLPSDYVGKKFTFRIIEYSEGGRNVVLSRREILEEERLKKVAQLKETLQPGDVIEGTVQKLAPFGAFVDIGGIEGLVPMSELAWYRVADVADVLSSGQKITVKILDLDWDRKRISLSIKQTLDDPWDSAVRSYPEQTKASGIVTKLMNFGAFVQLEPGLEGLVHISNFGTGRRLRHPGEVLSEGEQVQVRVLSVDPSAKRIGLELIGAEAASQGGAPDVELREGDVVPATVDSVKDYGVFMALPGGKSGLLHVSEIGDQRSGDFRGRFPVGASVEVEVRAIDPESGKISLSTKSLGKRVEESQFKDFVSDKSVGASFGTLGDILRDKLKK